MLIPLTLGFAPPALASTPETETLLLKKICPPARNCIDIRDSDGEDFPLTRLIEWDRGLPGGLHSIQITLHMYAGKIDLSLDGQLLDPEDAIVDGDAWIWTVPVEPVSDLEFATENIGEDTAYYNITLAPLSEQVG
jgi:hypothetical protein